MLKKRVIGGIEMKTTQVRPYASSDLERVIELAQESHLEIATRLEKDPQPEMIVKGYQDHYLKQGTKYQVLVAIQEEEIVGYIVGAPITGMPEIDCGDGVDPNCTPVSQGKMIFVTAESRTQGIGKQLMSALGDFVKKKYGHTTMEALVAKWNEPGLALCRSLGYSERDEERRYCFTLQL